MIMDGEVLYIDVACPLATWHMPIIFQQHSTLVVLIYQIISDAISLFLKEISCP